METFSDPGLYMIGISDWSHPQCIPNPERSTRLLHQGIEAATSCRE
jgi:hypothetical protein